MLQSSVGFMYYAGTLASILVLSVNVSLNALKLRNLLNKNTKMPQVLQGKK